MFTLTIEDDILMDELEQCLLDAGLLIEPYRGIDNTHRLVRRSKLMPIEQRADLARDQCPAARMDAKR